MRPPYPKMSWKMADTVIAPWISLILTCQTSVLEAASSSGSQGVELVRLEVHRPEENWAGHWNSGRLRSIGLDSVYSTAPHCTGLDSVYSTAPQYCNGGHKEGECSALNDGQAAAYSGLCKIQIHYTFTFQHLIIEQCNTLHHL